MKTQDAVDNMDRITARPWLILSCAALGLALCCVWVVLRSSGAAKSEHTIAFIAQTTGDELWEAAHAGARAMGEQTGFRVYWNAPTREDDVERQIELIQAAIRRRDAGLIVGPVQYLALISPLREALTMHIPVVVAASSVPLPPGNGLVYILSDDAAAGRIAAQRIGSILNGRGTIAVLGVNPNLTGVVVRARSFEETMAANFPGVLIVERKTAAPTFEEAAESAEQILLDHPNIDAIVGLTSTDSEGALTAISILHRTPAVHLIGCDQEDDLMKGIREGKIDSIIAENSFAIGEQAVAAIAAMRRGQSVQASVLVPPLLIDRTNIDRPDIQKVLSMNWRGAP
ncbi:MAG: substrate-binding domain-containing protein [Acidobacteriaceae bacterium]